jgi:DNA segregation ATPase FtsK/SpoIIIE, S-DNA-T family
MIIKLDELVKDVCYYIVEKLTKVDINTIQNQFQIGFSRAQEIVVFLEKYKVVSEAKGTPPREVLISSEELKNKHIFITLR